MWMLLGLAAGTFVSEDAALAGAAGLARGGAVSPIAAGLAVAAGIWLGDVLLFAAGRLSLRSALIARHVARRWPPTELQALAGRLDRQASWAIVLSRVVPGTRVPLYVAAGVLRVRIGVFLLSSAVAVGAWTAVVVGGVQWLR